MTAGGNLVRFDLHNRAGGVSVAAEDDEVGAGERRNSELSGKFNFGDTSPLTRFVIGLDEALQGYHGSDETPGVTGPEYFYYQ